MPPAPVAAAFEIHEWGLLSFALARPEGRVVATAGPTGACSTGSTIGHGSGYGSGSAYAPVLYAHLLDATPLARFDVALGVPAADVVETWPRARDGTSWSVVASGGGGCGARYPAIDASECVGAFDGICEAAIASAYEADDGACLTIDGAPADHLLYRALVDASALPLVVRREGSGFVVRASLARQVFRVRRTSARETHVSTVELPTGEERPLPEEPGGSGANLDQLETGLHGAGLTPDEAAAFHRAWRGQLVPSEDEPPPETTTLGATPNDALYYWLTAEEASRILPLVVSPPPTALRRALLVRVSLDPPVASGHELAVEALHAEATGIPGAAAERVARRHQNEVRFCTGRAGTWDTSFPADGALAITLTLAPDGHVATATATATPADAALGVCATTRAPLGLSGTDRRGLDHRALRLPLDRRRARSGRLRPLTRLEETTETGVDFGASTASNRGPCPITLLPSRSSRPPSRSSGSIPRPPAFPAMRRRPPTRSGVGALESWSRCTAERTVSSASWRRW